MTLTEQQLEEGWVKHDQSAKPPVSYGTFYQAAWWVTDTHSGQTFFEVTDVFTDPNAAFWDDVDAYRVFAPVVPHSAGVFPEGEAEPVGWRVKDFDETWNFYETWEDAFDKCNETGNAVMPVFTHPPAVGDQVTVGREDLETILRGSPMAADSERKGRLRALDAAVDLFQGAVSGKAMKSAEAKRCIGIVREALGYPVETASDQKTPAGEVQDDPERGLKRLNNLAENAPPPFPQSRNATLT